MISNYQVLLQTNDLYYSKTHSKIYNQLAQLKFCTQDSRNRLSITKTRSIKCKFHIIRSMNKSER